MKKVINAILILCSTANIASAQFYVNLGGGYAAAQAGQTIDAEGNAYNGSLTNGVVYSMKSASFATGVWGGIGAGYMGSSNIGVELDANLGISNKQYTYNNYNTVIATGPTQYGNESIVQKATSPFLVIPSLVVQSGGDPWNLYCRLGVALPLNTKITQDQIYSTLPGAGAVEVEDVTYQIKNSFSLGFAAAAGIQYKINDRLKIWGEVSLLSMSLFIKEADYKNISVESGGVAYTVNYTGPLLVKYSKNVTLDTVNYAQLPAYSQPFSNVGLNVGVSFRLSEKKERHSKHVRSDNARLREERDSNY